MSDSLPPPPPSSARPRRHRPRRSRRWQVQRFAVAVLVVWALFRLARHLAPPAALPESVARVERVIDGDTLELGGGQRIRLLGIDTPEMVTPAGPAEPLAVEAGRFMSELVEGREVRLEFDRERLDPYRRVLAYVWLDERFVNAEIVRAGFSRAETRFPLRTDRKRLLEGAEREARDARRGLWNRPVEPDLKRVP